MLAVFAHGILGFAGLMLVHIAAWRLLRVRRQMLWLFLIFLGVPLAALAALPDYRLASFLALCLGAAYVQAYPAAQAQSPSLVMLILIHSRRKQGGVDRDEVIGKVGSARLLQDRLDDLDRDGLAGGAGGKLELKPAGRALAAFFYWFRLALHLPRGHG